MKKYFAIILLIFVLSCSAKNRYNLLLISFDTLRVDYVSYYNKKNARTINFDYIAANGVFFKNAFAPAPITTPSHATIFTGLYPFSHGVRSNGGYKIPEEVKTLTEYLKEEGYQTGGFIGAFPLDKRFGFSKGFDVYDDEIKPAPFSLTPFSAERRAEEVADRAIQWLDSLDKDKPFFLFVHFYDPHYPYNPPEEFKKRYPDSYYTGEVEYADNQAGRILNYLKEKKLPKKTVIAFLSDHGEALGEHNEKTHMIFLYNSTIHIPWAMSGPKIPKGKVITEEVSLVDFCPTILNILLGKNFNNFDGRDLSYLFYGKKKENKREFIYSESLLPQIQYNWAPLRAIINYPWKFILAPKKELYNILEDYQETNNLYDRNNKIAERMEYLIKNIESKKSVSKSNIQNNDDETLRKLQSLGYIGSFSKENLSTIEEGLLLPDPKEKINIFNEFEEKFSVISGGRAEDAIKAAEEVLEKYPEEKWIKLNLMKNLFDQKKYRELITNISLDEAKAFPEKLKPNILLLRVKALIEIGDLKEALKEINEVRKYEKEKYVETDKIEARIYFKLKNYKKADEIIKKAKEINPEDPGVIKYAGILEIIKGNYKSGMEMLYSLKKRSQIEKDPLLDAALFILDIEKEKAAGFLKEIVEREQNSPIGIEATYFLTMIENKIQNKMAEMLKRSREKMNNHDFKGALEILKEIEKENIKSAEVYYDISICYLSLKDVNNAKKYLLESIKLDSNFAPAYCDLGFISEMEGKIKEALTYYQKALINDPNYYPALTRFGVLLSKLSKHDMAIKMFYRALDNAPDKNIALNNLITALEIAGRKEEAENLKKKYKF